LCDGSIVRQLGDIRINNPARILGLEGYGLEAGCNADFVLLLRESWVVLVGFLIVVVAGYMIARYVFH